MAVLRVENLAKSFSAGRWPFKKTAAYTAVDALSFDLKQGEILGLLGPNGAGKTTTIQMLLGTLIPTSGSITYFGTNFERNRIAALRKIGYASGYDKLPSRITVFENLDIIGRIYGLSAAQRNHSIEKLLTVFGIWEMRDRQTGTLSAGQATRMMLAKAFIADPKIVLLDEPTASLDPDIAHEVRAFISEQRTKRGVSVLITSHNMDEVTELCDRVLVLKEGRIIADDTPESLARSISKVHVHLTVSHALDSAIIYLQEVGVVYEAEANQLKVEVDEHAIAQLIINLGNRGVVYSQISIDKPTLEDYFLTIAE